MKLHTSHFDLALALVSEDGGVGLNMTGAIRVAVRVAGTPVLTGLEVGKVALDIAIGTASPGGLEPDSVVHDGLRRKGGAKSVGAQETWWMCAKEREMKRNKLH